MTFFTLLCQIFIYHCCTAFCLPFITADTHHCLPGSLREIYCIYILLFLHFFRYVDAIDCHFHRIFLGDPSHSAGLVDHSSHRILRFPDALDRCKSHIFIRQPKTCAILSTGKDNKPSVSVRIQISLMPFVSAQRERILFKIVIDPVRDFTPRTGLPGLSRQARCS